MVDESFTLDAGQHLRVVFQRRSDRVAHAIQWLDDQRRVLLQLDSVEGTPADAWPPSPALQHLRVEPRGGGQQVALLVGMAGRTHWSASVEADPLGGRLIFDIACRLPQPPLQLGSQYQMRGGPPTDATADQWLPSPPIETSARLIQQGALWRLDANALIDQFPATARWRYQAAVCPPK
jgi:hypothetical protein